ncbi:MAG: fasciclin domain-containing protein [Balneolaceae bacterium]
MKHYTKFSFRGFYFAFLLIILIPALIAGCKEKKGTTIPHSDNLIETLELDGNFTILTELLEGTQLANTLSGSNKYTIFAPVDASFSGLQEGYLEGLTDVQIQELLRYHIISGQVLIGTETTSEFHNSLQGDPVFITAEDTEYKINNSANVNERNQQASNGTIHAVDEVLFPDTFGSIADNIKKRPALNSLFEHFSHLELLNLLETEENLTLVVPPPAIYNDIESWLGSTLTDEQKIEIWKYNMVPQDLSGFGPGTQTALETIMGDSLYFTVSGTNQYTFNLSQTGENSSSSIRSANGTLYELDGLLLPDKYTGVLTLMDKRFYLNTARVALATAKMTGRMYNSDNNADEQFTVFIPRNESTGLDNLPADEEGLAGIFKYHVLLEKITADQLQHNQTYTTWLGEEITITRNGDQIVINGAATITLPDLEGTNGMVHVIDSVLTPPAD